MKLTPGTIIDSRYQILSTIGAGGMGAVYKAQHLMLDRAVAVKLLDARGTDDPELLPRFEREAIATNALKHRNIVMFYGYGVWNNAPYMVMECIPGRDLESLLQETGSLSAERSLNVAIQICAALDCAHSNGIVHRDLKPSNIIITTDVDGKDLVKVIDFGLAKVLPKSGMAVQKLTEAGCAVGSVLYMSPEQCLGQEVDARSDIYGLGCILQHCLTGEPVFYAEHSVVIMKKHLREQPASLAKLCPEKTFPPGLQDILRKALAKHPADRYQSASGMSSALMNVNALPADSDSKEPTRYKSIDSTILNVVPTSRSKPLLFMLAGACLSLAGITIIGLSPSPQPKIAEKPSIDYYVQAKRAPMKLAKLALFEKAISLRADGRLGAWKYFDCAASVSSLYNELGDHAHAAKVAQEALDSPQISVADSNQRANLIVSKSIALGATDRATAFQILEQAHAEHPDQRTIGTAFANLLITMGQTTRANEILAHFAKPQGLTERSQF